MKKHSRILTLSAVLLCGLLTACNGGGSSIPSDPSVGPTSSSSESSSSEQKSDTQKAIDNFIAKIKDGNYTITAPNLVTSVYSKDLMMLEYDESVQGAKDEGVMSVNNETFKLNLENAKLFDYLLFVDKGQAINVLDSLNLNYWINHGDFTDFWKHDEQATDPFRLYSTSKDVKKSIGQFYVIGELAVGTISNMVMEFDSVDVNTATITAKYVPGGKAEDIRIDITFGDAKYDQRLVDWINDPNRQYPKDVGKTGWTTIIDTLIASETMSSNIKKYVPLAPFASYAVICNDATFLTDGYVMIHDYHATRANVDDYTAILEDSGFYKITMDGTDWYRMHLRSKEDNPDFEVFDDISVSYDDGLTIIINAYYNRQTMHSFDTLNTYLKAKGFAELPASSEAITEFEIINSPFEAQEDLMYLCNYDFVGRVILHYEDKDAMQQYINDYSAALEAKGFTLNETVSELRYDYANLSSAKMFKCYDNEDGTFTLWFNNEVYLDPNTVLTEINEIFHEITMDNLSFVRDNRTYQRLKKGETWTHYYDVGYVFPDSDTAKAFFEAYDELYSTSPDYKKNEGWQKNFPVYDKNDGNQVSYTYSGNIVNFWFAIK